MATIKALEGRTVHQIQSGQVIVDLCSVVKELVENSMDAGATSVEVRFRNHGLDAIEVQDNGVGISGENYETLALKHYTSKLSSYDDLSSLQTFGFRGEALSSLCALSKLSITTAQADEAPKGTRLDFEVSGKLRNTQVVASQQGTTVAVEAIFRNLPVRRRELEKNIKREYGKALGVLQAYACISTQARISVHNMIAKGKKAVIFTTRSNPTVRENIANIFGAKVLPGLITMDLSFEMQPPTTYSQLSDPKNKQVRVTGHVSRPTIGEGRQAPDRQMFFINARPCVLPQITKIFNEVYKTYNVSQSPFVFANIILDTNGYDVNVSPDKRTIFLHDQNIMLESLRTSLIELFDGPDQSIPVSQRHAPRLRAFKQLSVPRESSDKRVTAVGSFGVKLQPLGQSQGDSDGQEDISTEVTPRRYELNQNVNSTSLIEKFAGRNSRETSNRSISATDGEIGSKILSKDKQKLVKKLGRKVDDIRHQLDEDNQPSEYIEASLKARGSSMAVEDFNERIAEQQPNLRAKPIASSDVESEEPPIGETGQRYPPSSSIVQNAFDRMRPRRSLPEVATITIGSKIMSSVISPSPSTRLTQDKARPSFPPRVDFGDVPKRSFSSSMRSFAAPGSELRHSTGRQEGGLCSANNLQDDGESQPSTQEGSSPVPTSDDPEMSATNSEDKTQNVRKSEESEDLNTPFSETGTDGIYVDDVEKQAIEEARVSELIRQAEEASTLSSQDNRKRAYEILKGTGQKKSIISLIQVIDASVERIYGQLHVLAEAIRQSRETSEIRTSEITTAAVDAPPEEHLSLTVSKADFGAMHIVGQFNLGFILAARNATDLFIIDQHASDEKCNFERLRATTTVQNQRLVQPHVLRLTAIEEEVILEHNEALLKNGFLIDVDTSGDAPVGERCRIVSLPMSREVVFDITDLEELIALLADSFSSSSMRNVPRPSKIRRMFAMRACRSSIMVGKTLTLKQMGSLVRKMGEIDKPWNCPHGRPTMRHVCALKEWECWSEDDGLTGMEEASESIDWTSWMSGMSDKHDDEGHRDTDEEHSSNDEEHGGE